MCLIDCMIQRCATQQAILRKLGIISGQLTKIENSQRREEHTMSQVEDDLTAEDTAIGNLQVGVDRIIADLGSVVAGALTPEQQAQFDAHLAKLSAMTAAIDTADPATPAP